MEMHNPPHPGQLINDIYLAPYSLSVEELADKLGLNVERIASVIAQNAGIDAALAIRLEAVLGGSARSWMGMQSSYDISVARKGIDLSGLAKMSFPELGEVPNPDKYYA
ncbi:MAG TPA: HigA family addiction module antitoxin [Telluria sp.]|nr:HigA family addiction module antitoxin [Telluria sp.]